jgi:hypothetical protein
LTCSDEVRNFRGFSRSLGGSYHVAGAPVSCRALADVSRFSDCRGRPTAHAPARITGNRRWSANYGFEDLPCHLASPDLHSRRGLEGWRSGFSPILTLVI